MIDLEPARWPNGPKICPVANLPAFPTPEAQAAFHEANGPRCHIERVWLCTDCGHYHADSDPPDPTGTTSGTGRSQKRYALRKTEAR